MKLKRNVTVLTFLALSALAGCGEVDHTLGGDSDRLSGMAAGGSTSHAGGSTSLPPGDGGEELAGTGGAGEGDPNSSDGCDSECGAGDACFRDLDDPESGTCAPLCDSDEQTAWGQPCANGLDGEEGVCRPFLRATSDGTRTPTGVCTGECDPLAQECPSGFSCDVTESFAGSQPPKTFACLPVVKALPSQAGDACDGWPTGSCAPGLSCIQESSTYTCRAFCDTSEPGACPGSESCTKPEWFPAEPANVGVCTP